MGIKCKASNVKNNTVTKENLSAKFCSLLLPTYEALIIFCIDFYFWATIGWVHGCPNRGISYCFCPQACKTLVTPLSFPLNMWCMRFPTSPRMYSQPVILTRHTYFLNCLFVDMPDKTWLGETTEWASEVFSTNAQYTHDELSQCVALPQWLVLQFQAGFFSHCQVCSCENFDWVFKFFLQLSTTITSKCCFCDHNSASDKGAEYCDDYPASICLISGTQAILFGII